MQSRAATVDQYLAELPEDRRSAMIALRDVIRQNLDGDYEEGMQYGMIGYYVPHRVFPPGYHCDPRQPLPYMALASQKNHLSLYSMVLYADPALLSWFERAWTATGRKLDMGKSCIRFKRLDDVPLEVVAEMVRRTPAAAYIAIYERSLAPAGRSSAGRTAKTAGRATQTPAKSNARKPSQRAAKTTAKQAAPNSARRPAKRSGK